MIDNKLNFQEHINIKVNKANQKLGMINRTFIWIRKCFLHYISLVHPHLECGSLVWSVINTNEAIKIENAQKGEQGY